MRMRLVFARCMRLVAALGAFAAGAASGQPGVFAQYEDYSGTELFERFCAACHGESAQGDGPVAASLAVPVPDLTRLSQRRAGTFPANEVREIIDGRSPIMAHGPRQMPVWGYEFWIEEGADVDAEVRSREMIARIVRYLAEIQLPDGGAQGAR
jgi:mono/diheme cytochrome c family protein